MPSPIATLEAWTRASLAEQDSALGVIGARLGPAYRHLGARRYADHEGSCRIGSFRHEASGAVLRLLPGGRFRMGDDASPWPFDKPAHEVRIRRPFLLGESPLSQACWDSVGGDDARSIHGPSLPINKVSPSQALCWLARAGDGLRLPSEAEWEYACRAGTSGARYFEDEALDAHCWTLANSGGRPRAVDAHSEHTNAFGLSDTLGNVWEWCADHFFEDYQGAPADERPREPPAGSPRRFVYRGLGWNARAPHVSSTNRNGRDAHSAFSMVGLRLARSLPRDLGADPQ